jgi:uncharacterized repeat protein (TIGR03943 family)
MRQRLDPRLVARASMLAIWAGFFVYLRISGEATRYIGPRTSWVVPFGAIALSAAALLHLRFLTSEEPNRLTKRESLWLAVTILPIVLALMIPDAQLGAQAASRKTVGGGLADAIAYAPPGAGERELSFIDFHYANLSEDYGAAAGLFEGRPLELTGFVTHLGTTPGFRLTRFYISCCAADAVPYSVAIVHNQDFPDDTWLTVTGVVTRTADGLALEATGIKEIEPPREPYLS